jgi:hypothetical protein
VNVNVICAVAGVTAPAPLDPLGAEGKTVAPEFWT